MQLSFPAQVPEAFLFQRAVARLGGIEILHSNAL